MVLALGCTCHPEKSEPSYASVNLRLRSTFCRSLEAKCAHLRPLRRFTKFYLNPAEASRESGAPSAILENFPGIALFLHPFGRNLHCMRCVYTSAEPRGRA